MLKIHHSKELKEFQRRLKSLEHGLNQNNVKATNEVILSLIEVMRDYITFEETVKCDCTVMTQPLN